MPKETLKQRHTAIPGTGSYNRELAGSAFIKERQNYGMRFYNHYLQYIHEEYNVHTKQDIIVNFFCTFFGEYDYKNIFKMKCFL